MTKRELKSERIAKKTEKAKNSADGDAAERRSIPARFAGVMLAVVAVVFLVYSMISLIGIRSKIRDLNADLGELRSEIANQERRNKEMEAIVNQSDDELTEYMERIAHDHGLVYEGEKIFIVESGD